VTSFGCWILQNNGLCSDGCGVKETVNHLFLSCLVFVSLWHLVLQWLGMHYVCPYIIIGHVIQFGSFSFLSPLKKKKVFEEISVYFISNLSVDYLEGEKTFKFFNLNRFHLSSLSTT